MSVVPRLAPVPRSWLLRPGGRFPPTAVVWAAIITVVAIVLAVGDPSSISSALVGNVGVTVALLYGGVSCLQAALRRTEASRAWAWMSAAIGMAAAGQMIFTYSILAGNPATVSPISDSFGYLGYFVPAVIALFLFPKPPARRISRLRTGLDAAVITFGVVLVSEATVLSQVRDSVDLSTLTGISGLAFPIVDLAICAVVLTMGMHTTPEYRLVWMCLGCGLVIQAVIDSVYVTLRLESPVNLTGTALAAGWMAAPVLIGLATLVPRVRPEHGRDLALAVRLVPYIPVLAAMIVVGATSIGTDRFLLVESVLLLVTVAVRQVMIVYENLSLTRDLESKVATRTAELATLGSIVTSSTDAIVGLSTTNRVTAWNPAAERLYGVRRADVVGTIPTFLSPDAADQVRSLLDSASRGEKLNSYEVEWHRPDGTSVPVAMTVSPVYNGKTVEGISVIGQDITERRQIAASLEQAREEALESSRLKSEFLATMSHEIRTPMNGVIGLTSLLLDTDLDAMQRKYADGVQSAGQSLLDVINDILDFSKLEAGKVIIDQDDFDLRRLVENVGNLLAPAAFAKGLELLVSCPPDAPATVRGDHVRIRQILLNLASNAVKFTATGEVAVKVEARDLEDGRVGLRFEVIDTGIGIAESDQQRLFESFSQADASTTRRFGGTGLGLAICRRLVEVMDGTIGLRSVPGVGSTFWFEIPLLRGSAAAEPPLPGHSVLAGLRVLVVDDNATNLAILDAQLTSWRMTAHLIDNATSALELLRAAVHRDEAYDLLVLDMMMPDVDGLQLAHIVTADPALTGTPMIMLTSAQRLPSTVLREAGIGQWLSKPVISSELYERLTRLLTREESPRERGGKQPAPSSKQARSRGTVLVVEDNQLNQLVAAGLVARLGYAVDTVNNGAEALAATEKTAYAGILMDCHMPVMDGFAATRELRRREAGRTRTPVIALTAGALMSDRERCLAAGMDDYLAKPVNDQDLENVLARWLTRPADHDQSSVEPAEPRPDPSTLDLSRLEVLRGLQAPDGSSLMSTFVASFTSRSSNRLAALRAAVASGDRDGLASAAHELRGSASTIGALQVTAISEVLERAGHAGSPVEARLLDELEVELGRAAAALAEVDAPLGTR